MLPRFTYKINVALFICFAFAFRLLFLNVFVSPSLKSTQASRFATAHFNKVLKKRRRSNETIIRSDLKAYVAEDIIEENPDEEKAAVKADKPVLLSFLRALYKKVTGLPGRQHPFNRDKYNLPSHQQPALSVLRI